jgi:ketosteroid isomerase-like protein
LTNDSVLTLSVEDRLLITELTYRYAYHVDRYELAPLLALWTEDAIFDERPVGLFYAEGIEQIREFFEHDFKITTAHSHLMTNHIVCRVSETQAHGTCYGVSDADLPSGEVVRATYYYTDDYVKRDGSWVFKSRVVRPFGRLDLGNVQKALRNEIAKRD